MVNSGIGCGYRLSVLRLSLRGFKQDVNQERYIGIQAGTPVQTSVVVISIAVYKIACTLSAYTLALTATTRMMPAPAALSAVSRTVALEGQGRLQDVLGGGADLQHP